MIDFISKISKSVTARIYHLPSYTVSKTNDLDFCDIFKEKNGFNIIAEIKYASPSSGRIYPGLDDPLSIAGEYILHGARAISILTEPEFFAGDINRIQSVRKHFPTVHILQKDFILSQAQIAQAINYGANAVLLIAAFLNASQLRDLYDYALSLGLTAVVEVHDLEELERALKLNPKVIGINNRNLKTLEIDLDTSRSLVTEIPNHIHVVCESGLNHLRQLQEMKSLGFDGFLMGSHFMKHDNPGQVLCRLLKGEGDES